MEQKNRIDVLQQMLSKLAGESSQPTPVPGLASSKPKVNVEPTAQAAVVTPEPAAASRGERKMQLLKSMLARLEDL